MSLSAALFLVISQQAGAVVVADYPDDPESWSLEYPSVITAQVEDYYNCLRSGQYVVGDGRGFEAQYREDIPRCAELGAELEAAAIARLAERSSTGADVPAIFAHARRVHVERGRSLDDTVRTRLASSARYRNAAEADSDRQCVAKVQALREARRVYADANGARVEAVFGKSDYTDEDRRAMAEYQGRLARYSASIEAEVGRCPAAAYDFAAAPASEPAKQ